MFQYILWGISFVTLWLTIVWLNFLYAEPEKKKKRRAKLTVAIPVFSRDNDKDTIKTITSLFTSGYPKKLLDVIVVDDGSTDDTLKKLRAFKKSSKHPFRLYTKENGGKASALNHALKRSKGTFFAVVDADSRISKGSIDISMSNFTDDKIGAVISRVRVDSPKSFLARMQRFEYIMSSMTRKIMCNFGTLSITPGVLSMYRTKVLKDLGGFVKDKENLTEDLEIALRLKYNGYRIRMEPNSITYTHVPNDLNQLWRQRVRWARGYIYNHLNYKKMFFSQKHGLFGTFQLPINVIAVILLVANVGIIFYDLMSRLSEFLIRSFTIPDYFFNKITSFPTLREFILARNIQIYLPIIIALILGIYIVIFAHRMFKEKLRHQITPLVAYTLVMPYFSTVNWVSSVWQEATKAKRKW